MYTFKKLYKKANEDFLELQRNLGQTCMECQRLEMQELLSNPSDIEKHSTIFMEMLDKTVYLQNEYRRAIKDVIRECEKNNEEETT